MKAALLVEPGTLEIREIPDPKPGPRDVVVAVDAVGICGSDVHIHAGHINWNVDADGREISLADSPQILGHEIVGTIVETGAEVDDVAIGERVVVDQGINCASRGRPRDEWCDYCSTGYSHHCADYAEHGITGLPGGFADLIAVPAVNVVRVDDDMSDDRAAMTEPLGCVLHSLRLAETLGGRFGFDRSRESGRGVDTVALAGLGPGGQLFGQALRGILGFDGTIVASDPDPGKRARAVEDFDAVAVEPGDADEMAGVVREVSDGRGAEILVDACGAPTAWRGFASMIRKQGTAILYGFGRERGSGGSLDSLQWRGAHLVATSGASGPLDEDGRPGIYREALEHLAAGRVVVDELFTHRYGSLDELDRALGPDPNAEGYLKGVLLRAD